MMKYKAMFISFVPCKKKCNIVLDPWTEQESLLFERCSHKKTPCVPYFWGRAVTLAATFAIGGVRSF